MWLSRQKQKLIFSFVPHILICGCVWRSVSEPSWGIRSLKTPCVVFICPMSPSSFFLVSVFVLYSGRLARGVQKGYEGIKKSRTTEPLRSDPVWSLYFDLVNNFKNNLQNCINRLGRGHKPAQWKKATEWHLKWSSPIAIWVDVLSLIQSISVVFKIQGKTHKHNGTFKWVFCFLLACV